MDRIANLIGAARIAGNLEQDFQQIETKPTGLLDPIATDAPPVIIKLYNQCQKDKALLSNSDALITFYEIAAGKSEASRNYWKHANAFRQTLDRLEKLLTPLPKTPLEVKALIEDMEPLLKGLQSLLKWCYRFTR